MLWFISHNSNIILEGGTYLYSEQHFVVDLKKQDNEDIFIFTMPRVRPNGR